MVNWLKNIFKKPKKYGLIMCYAYEKEETEQYKEELELAQLINREIDTSVPRFQYKPVPYSFHLSQVISVTEMINSVTKENYSRVDLPHETIIVSVPYIELIDNWIEYKNEGLIDYIPREDNN